MAAAKLSREHRKVVQDYLRRADTKMLLMALDFTLDETQNPRREEDANYSGDAYFWVLLSCNRTQKSVGLTFADCFYKEARTQDKRAPGRVPNKMMMYLHNRLMSAVLMLLHHRNKD